MRRLSRRTFFYAVGGTVLWHGALDAASGPAVVMLMRHGEDKGEKGVHLSPKGRKRAEALPRLFGSRLPKPDVIIATRATKGSNRPVETAEPLAKALGLPIDNRFRDDDWAQLAKAVTTDSRYDGKVLLIVWHHGSMDNLARAIGAKGVASWPDRQFDHVWVIDFKKSGKARFDDVHQQLLEGDT